MWTDRTCCLDGSRTLGMDGRGIWCPGQVSGRSLARETAGGRLEEEDG